MQSTTHNHTQTLTSYSAAQIVKKPANPITMRVTALFTTKKHRLIVTYVTD